MNKPEAVCWHLQSEQMKAGDPEQSITVYSLGVLEVDSVGDYVYGCVYQSDYNFEQAGYFNWITDKVGSPMQEKIFQYLDRAANEKFNKQLNELTNEKLAQFMRKEIRGNFRIVMTHEEIKQKWGG